MAVYKEINRADGSGVTTFYRLSNVLDTAETDDQEGQAVIFDYNEAQNKPSINGVTLVGDKTSEDLGLQPAGDYITNDEADAKFIDEDELLAYDYVNQTQLEEALANIEHFHREIVNALPVTGRDNVLYMVRKEGSGEDIYNEYIWVGLSNSPDGYEFIGTTATDLTDYYKKSEVNTLLNNKVDKEYGKGLSEQNYTLTEKTKLAGLENYDDTEIQSHVATLSNTVSGLSTTSTSLNNRLTAIEPQVSSNTAAVSTIYDLLDKKMTAIRLVEQGDGWVWMNLEGSRLTYAQASAALGHENCMLFIEQLENDGKVIPAEYKSEGDHINVIFKDLDSLVHIMTCGEDDALVTHDVTTVNGLINFTVEDEAIGYGTTLNAVYGNTYQYNTTGKNLFDKDGTNFEGHTGINNFNGKKIINNSSVGNNAYTLSDNNGRCQIYFKGEIGQTYYLSFNSNYNIRAVKAFGSDGIITDTLATQKTITMTTNYVGIIMGKADTTDFTDAQVLELKNSIQIESGSSPTDYEPYTGGIPSPNPDYPQDIKTVTGNIMLRTESTNKVDLTPLTVDKLAGTNGSQNIVSEWVFDEEIGRNVYHLKRLSTGAAYPCAYFSLPVGRFNPKGKNWAIVYKYKTVGSLAGDTSYGAWIGFNGRNLWETINVNSGGNIKNAFVTASTNWNIGYTLIPKNNSVYDTYSGSYRYMSVCLGMAQVEMEIYVSDIMVVEITDEEYSASTYTPPAFEQYQGQAFTLSLGSIELCKVDTHQDKIYKNNGAWYLHKEIGKHIVTAEDITQCSDFWYASLGLYAAGIDKSVLGLPIDVEVQIPSLCNSYTLVESFSDVGQYSFKRNRAYLFFVNNTFENLTQAKAQVAGTILYYVLNEPSDIEIEDPTLLAQLEALEQITQYKDTYITITGADLTPEADFTYISDIVINNSDHVLGKDTYWNDEVPTSADLPADAQEGEIRIVQDTEAVYIYDGTDWIPFDKGTEVDLSNYLAKDNTTAWIPTGPFNPATKKYVDDSVSGLHIPTKVSQLQNDSNFVTASVNNLTNYYLKTNTYTKNEVDALIAGGGHAIDIVDDLNQQTSGKVLDAHQGYVLSGRTVPAGGSTGQVLKKESNTDYDTSWTTLVGIPGGGTSGQALIKSSATNYDAAWTTIYTIPSGGTSGQALVKSSNSDYAVTWGNIPNITSGTANPSGGSDGDIYLKYDA